MLGRLVALLLSLTLSIHSARAEGPSLQNALPEAEKSEKSKIDSDEEFTDQIFLKMNLKREAALTVQEGSVVVGDGLATLDLSDRFRFVDGPQATKEFLNSGVRQMIGRSDKKILPRDTLLASYCRLGMIWPADIHVFGRHGRRVAIDFLPHGHVYDGRAEAADYVAILQERQENAASSSTKQRKLIRWKVPPRYDRERRQLFWAEEYDDLGQRECWYHLCIFGRRGVLRLTAAVDKKNATAVEADMRELQAIVKFNEGHRYEDFDRETDQRAGFETEVLVSRKSPQVRVISWLLLTGIPLFAIGLSILIAWLRSPASRQPS